MGRWPTKDATKNDEVTTPATAVSPVHALRVQHMLRHTADTAAGFGARRNIDCATPVATTRSPYRHTVPPVKLSRNKS